MLRSPRSGSIPIRSPGYSRGVRVVIVSMFLLLLVGACKKATAPAPTPRDAISVAPLFADAAAIDAGVALADLTRAVPLTVRVSSRVANPKIKLEHLVDRDLDTAWNSRTGELVGAWLEIEVPDGSVVHELRFTVGNTGTGPKGEDYFTMNPRIRRVAVWHRGKDALGTFALDIEKRGLQTLALRAAVGAGTIRIQIEDVANGTKARWREVCVSELEVWGVPPAGTALPGTRVPTVTEDSVSRLQKICEQFDVNEEDCSFDIPNEVQEAPWAGTTIVNHATHVTEHHGHVYSKSYDENLVLMANGRVWLGPTLNQSSTGDDGGGSTGKTPGDYTTITDVTFADAVAGGAREIVVRYRVATEDQTATFNDFVVICATNKTCSAPIEAGNQDWEVTVRVARDGITRTKRRGSPPATAFGRSDVVLR
jgi:hypothetical protein